MLFLCCFFLSAYGCFLVDCRRVGETFVCKLIVCMCVRACADGAVARFHLEVVVAGEQLLPAAQGLPLRLKRSSPRRKRRRFVFC